MEAEPTSERHALIDVDSDQAPIMDQSIDDYFIIKQDVSLEVNFLERRIDGTTDIFIAVLSDKVEEVALDAAHCDINTDGIIITDLREAHGEIVEGHKRKATATYKDPYQLLSHPKNWNWTAEHHDLRRMRARQVFHSRKSDVPADNREVKGCTPAYGSLRISLKGKGDQDRPRLIIRKSTMGLDGSSPSLHRQYKITIPFTNTAPRDGLQFVGVDPLDNRFTHMYTRHTIHPGTASCIFPCMDDHGARCDWKVSFKFPRTLGDALQKPLASNLNGVSHASVTKMDIDDGDRGLDLSEEDKLREMTVICSGFLVEENIDPKDDRKKIMTFEPEKKTSVQKLGFAIGPFEHVDLSAEFRTEEDEVKLGLNALRVHAYCLPYRREWVRNTAAALTMAADHLTYTFAKYPFSNFKLCFLDDMVEETIPLHSLAFISTRLLFPEDIIDTDVDVTRKIVFTLAYQWIGINMIPNTRNDLWLVMGVAHYMTDIVMRKLCGNNEHRFRMKTMSDRLVEVDIDRPSLWDLGANLHLGDFEMDFMSLKAPVVFFILDKRLNKASGGHGLTRILQKLLTKAQIESSDRSTILDTEKFRATCEKPTRTRLESFWSQWVYGSGCPRFDVKAKFNKKRLCVELTLNQIHLQVIEQDRPGLERDTFLRAIRERRAGTVIGELQPLYTGPMTVRIHEADGTPYEHILEIREDATRSTKFEIPYNTKYKRLKRTRRLKEKHAGGANADAADGADEALLYCLGDVLQTPEDQKQWELIDWDPETERKMDQESYEWIRVDADFEWAAGMKHTLEPYMYVSQLQQDRDVVAQQDAMLYLASGPLHPIASGFLVRTLIDRRYFHGIRAMAAKALTRQANIKDLPMLGLRQLMMAYREMFCFENTSQPKPNDFTNKQQYKVRASIIQAIADVRDHTHRCPLEARQFILDQLLFNNNEENPVSDHYWIATLVDALATSLIPSQADDWLTRQSAPNEDERRFLESALEQIERVLRRDEWTNSYQNVWTIAGLDAKLRLMKAEVIPKNYADFGQYLLDGTADQIRIKCFEALVDLGAIMDHSVFTFLLYVLSTDRSPFVRNKLIQAAARGLAAVAFGEHEKAEQKRPADQDLDSGLVVQDSGQEIEARKEKFARKQNLDAALLALRKEMDETFAADERYYSTAMRKALDHPTLGRADVESLLDLAAMMFDEARDWIVTLNMPKGWKVERPAQQLADRFNMVFKSYYKTKPKEPFVATPAPAPEPKRPVTLTKTSSIKINTKTAGTPKPSQPPPIENGRPAASTPVSRAPSVSTSQTVSNPDLSSQPSTTIKRPRPDKEEPTATPVAKRPKMDIYKNGTAHTASNGPPRKRLMVLLKARPKRLALALGLLQPSQHRTGLPSGPKKEASPDGIRDSIIAKPRKPLPTGGEPPRKPLPGSGSSVTSSMQKKFGGRSASPAPSRPAPSPAPSIATPGSNPGRPKIKIIRKPQPPPAAQPPP